MPGPKSKSMHDYPIDLDSAPSTNRVENCRSLTVRLLGIFFNLREVQEALSEEFDGIECSIGPGPDLSQSPFRLEVPHLGRQITFVPDVALLDEFDATGLHRINLSKKSALFTDGQSSCCLELILGKGRNWRDPLVKLFDRLYPNKWAFFIAELEQSQPTYHLLCCNSAPISTRREDTPDSTEPSSQISSPPESVVESSNFSLWLVPVNRVFALPPPPPPPKKVRVVKKIVKKRTPNEDPFDETGEKKKLIRTVRKKLEKKEHSPSPESNGVLANGTTSTAPPTSDGGAVSDPQEPTTTKSSSPNASSNGVSQTAGTSNSMDGEENSSLSELRKKLMQAAESTSAANYEQIRAQTQSRISASRKSLTPDRRLDPIYEGKGRKERSASPSQVHVQEVVCRANGSAAVEFPVVALQMILRNYFSYEELGRLRAVHPHWDELCGQMLNNGYYKLLERSDKLLMMLQRKLPSDASLSFPTSILTSIQVHILNPVDIMRAVLDEGVCCFPYGSILDKTNALLDQIEFMLQGGDQDKIRWEPVALLAKKASLHYRTHLERTMEERLGEGLRLKAAQRILRLDSFLVESSVNKLEKDTFKARDELKWELEQLQQQNAQLRKDNRQLRADHMRLETRVEVLEQKFKTLARLLS
ncbi:hypothetical protein Q1695_010048 [Nippostrongylus brasiliensis]|nr:hypothetical protein Q1695_010048 [Nippostrongylus brasiliensis]